MEQRGKLLPVWESFSGSGELVPSKLSKKKGELKLIHEGEFIAKGRC